MNTWKLSEIEKESAIQNIVRRGTVSPADRIKALLDAGKTCPFGVLFFGVGDCLFLGVLITVCLWLFFLQWNTQMILCSVFALSPFAYISSFLLTTWKEHIVQLYEVKMSCHYTIRQITALRMIYFSLGNMFLNTAALLLFVPARAAFIPFWKTLGLSFSSLFLYGVILLLFQIRGSLRLSAAMPPLAWILLNCSVAMYYGERMEKMLLNLAGGLVFILVAATCMAYLLMLYSFSMRMGAQGN